LKKKRALFRADGNSQIGLGHISRLLALAEALKNTFDIVFLVQDPVEFIREQVINEGYQLVSLPATENYLTEAKSISGNYLNASDVIICDGYFIETAYQEILKESGAKLVYIDDLNAFPIKAELVINHSPGADAKNYKLREGAKALCGLNYILLRKPFLEAAKTTRTITNVDSVLICIGGADPMNFTTSFTEIVLEIEKIKNLTIITGNAFKHKTQLQEICESSGKNIQWLSNVSAEDMVNEIKKTHIAIVPASTISLECVAIGTGIITGYYVDNQKNIYEGLINNGLAFNGGNFLNMQKDRFFKNISDILNSPENINKQIKKQKEAVDGQSMNRILAHINNL